MALVAALGPIDINYLIPLAAYRCSYFEIEGDGGGGIDSQPFGRGVRVLNGTRDEPRRQEQI